MATETILQNWIFAQFALPFLLIFFITYGVLLKAKPFGEAKQLNALVAFVVGLIFVGAIFPKLVVGNLILFLTIALVTMFVGMLLWGFVAGDSLKFSEAPKQLRYFVGFVIILGTLFALLWALGVSYSIFGNFFSFVFKSSWSKDFWTNTSFLAVVIIALAWAINSGKPSGK